MADDRLRVSTTSTYLETHSFVNANGDTVHREGVFIGDGESSRKAHVSTGNALRVISDPAQLDAFARLRVSNPETIFDSKQIHNSGALLWNDAAVSGSGTGSTWSQNKASTTISVSATTAGRRVRQTYRRFNYQPGKSQLIIITFTLDASGGGAGITRGVGLYDDKNGFFLKDDEGTIKMVRRSYSSGSAVDTEVEQSSWNIDPLDGTGPSGVTADWTKANILLLDMEWLGVGRLRAALVIDGLPVYFHQFVHANVGAGVYMSTPNLPIRYEIENTGSGAASTLETICCSVMSEGGKQDIGISRYGSLGTGVIQANTVGTVYAVCGLRLKSANLDGVVRISTIRVINTTTDNFEWSLIFNPTVAGSPSWTDESNSVCQLGKGDTVNTTSATTVTGGTKIAGGYVTSAAGGVTISDQLDTAQSLGSSISGTADELWLCVMPLSANADIQGGIEWREIS